MKFFTVFIVVVFCSCGTPTNPSKHDSSFADSIADNFPGTDSALRENSILDTMKLDNQQSLIRNSQEEIVGIIKLDFPSGWEILDSMSGDLNRDQYMDMVVILRNPSEDSIDFSRPLLLYLGNPVGVQLVARNDSVVLCRNCGGAYGDPYSDIAIKNGYFTIEHYGGGGSDRWTRYITFKYSDHVDTWFLHLDAGFDYNMWEPEKAIGSKANEEDYGKVRFVDYQWE